MTTRLIAALVLGFVVAALLGRVYVPWLRKIHAGQEIREDGPTWHMSKAGTPTMGGVIFIAAVTAVVLTVGFTYIRSGDMGAIFVLLFSMFYGAIGFLDDFEKLKKKQNLGLSARAKFILQLVVAIALLYLLRLEGYLTPEAVYIPFWNVTISMPEWLYFILAAFIIVGTVNSVNLTDGVDGLAASVTVPVFVFYTAVCFAWGVQYRSLAVFAAGLTGGLFGFLIYNFHPAKCFMGDTGSLFLGGAVCGMAFALDMPLILVTLGIIYIIEALSDILQVAYFKLTHGKRIFKMAPFHHHLEMGGWSGHKWTEKQIVALFTGISLVFAVISFAGCIGRFG
ncbi:MAG: phospho-N-acetylmuramoyl-pentapeptide-transferase [Oscillospiraceae bacterium]|nr:phospho-N-acetylmuramoyl-pentapeptide-transferase [Oscillospiraceae bacterium]